VYHSSLGWRVIKKKKNGWETEKEILEAFSYE